jgi:hypothetical protein
MAVSPSSTSSSERGTGAFVLAIALAVLLLICFEWSTFGSIAVWEDLVSRVPRRFMHTSGVATARLALERAGQVEPGERFSVVLGSSRALFGYRPAQVGPEDGAPGPVFALKHPQLFPYEMLSYSTELTRLGPAEVVFLVSEFDTHRPLEFVSGSGSASLSALAFLIGELPRGISWRERTMLARLGLEGIVDTYRYRRVLGVAGTDVLRTFRLGKQRRKTGRGHQHKILGPGPPKDSDPEEIQQIADLLGEGSRKRGNRHLLISQLLLAPITPGEHADVQMALLEEAIRRLRGAGIEVIIVETPLSPLAEPIYDVGLRREFLSFAHSMVRAHGLRFVELDLANPYPARDFSDLVHLKPEGATRLTRTVHRAIHEARVAR